MPEWPAEVVALDGVFDRGQKFLPQPGFDEAPVELSLIDGLDHLDQVKKTRLQYQYTGAVGLDLFDACQEPNPCELRHFQIGQDKGKLLMPKLVQGATPREMGCKAPLSYRRSGIGLPSGQ